MYQKISIVVPSYNQGKFLEETLQSIIAQDYPNLELIVMDGGSNDNSLDVIERYKNRITHWVSAKDRGQSDAISRGFAVATGDILAWLNSDDVYRPGTLHRINEFFNLHPRYGFCCGDVDEIDAGGRYLRTLKSSKPAAFLTRHSGAHTWWQPSCFWRREVYFAVGGIDPELFFCMDRDLFIRICSHTHSAKIKGSSLAGFRVHENQKSQTSMREFLIEDKMMFDRYSTPAMRRLSTILARCFGLWRRLS